MNLKTLLIGGSGYIGSYLYNYLSRFNEVTSVDLEWFGNCNKNNIVKDFVNLDQSFIRSHQAVILLAGHTSVAMCENKGHISSYKNNVLNFIDLVQKLSPDQKFIYASSGVVHGQCKNTPATENEISVSKNIYDTTKKAIDDYMTISGLDYYSLRFGSVFGFSPQLRTDLVINRCVLNIHKNIDVDIYGSDIWRPFLDINDICRAVEVILNNAPRPGMYNLSSKNMNMGSLVNLLLEIFPQSKFNWKRQIPSYDFSLNTSKFCQNFDFKFNEDFTASIQNLYDNCGKCFCSERL